MLILKVGIIVLINWWDGKSYWIYLFPLSAFPLKSTQRERERERESEESNFQGPGEQAQKGMFWFCLTNMWVFYETVWFGLVVFGRCETGCFYFERLTEFN